MIKSVIFDFDGTLTEICPIDFQFIRKITGCPPQTYLLDYFKTLDLEARLEAEKILEDHETKAAEESVEDKYMNDLFLFFKENNISASILTRNSKRSIMKAMENFSKIKEKDFHKIITRDDPFPVKPQPHAIQHIAQSLNISTKEILMVGDYIHDIEAGTSAGATTAYKITNRENDHLIQADFKINSLSEIKNIISQSQHSNNSYGRSL